MPAMPLPPAMHRMFLPEIGIKRRRAERAEQVDLLAVDARP